MTLLTDRNKNHGASVQVDISDNKDSNMIEIIQKRESASFLQPAFAPKMMSVSKFLEPFDETSLTDEEASQKYSAYVAGFLKEQLNEHFEHHKTCAWFRDKYHPDYIISKEKERETLLTRFEIFKKMREMGFFNDISLEYKNRVALTRLLDQFAVLLAGGNSDDLVDLEKFDSTTTMLHGSLRGNAVQLSKSEPSETIPKTRSFSPKSKRLAKKGSSKRQKKKAKRAKAEGDDGNSSDSSTSSSSSTGSSSSNSSALSSFSNSSGSHQRSSSTHSTSLSTSGSSVISSSSSSSNHSSASETSKASKKAKEIKELDNLEPKLEQEGNAKDVKKEDPGGVEKIGGIVDGTVEDAMKKLPKIPLHATRVVYLPYLPLSIHRATIETLLSEHPDYLRFACLEPTPLPATTLNVAESPSLLLHRPAWITFTPVASESSSSPMEFIRHLVNRLRVDVASNDTSEASDLAAALLAARTLPGAFNIDRIRASTRLARILLSTTDKTPFNPIASKAVMRRHLVMAARLVGRLDEIWGLWKEPCNRENADWPIPRASDLDPRRGTNLVDLVDLASRTGNPLLESITDHLVDEFNSEELLLLSGVSKPSTKKEDGEKSQEAGGELARALDSMLIYLRLVYSIDFYAPAFYHRESDMPHPCSVFHVRPSKMPESLVSSAFNFLRIMPPPPNPVFRKEVTSKSAHRVFARQLSRIFRLVTPLWTGTITNIHDNDPTVGENAPAAMENPEASKVQRDMDVNESRLRRLGYRDVTEVVEAFIKANTKRKKRKVDVIWICPLSEKKFRGPGFVRKHILNKHAEKVEMEKKEKAHFFNNFLLDPMRPEFMHPPRRRLPIHLRRVRASSVADDNENEDEADVEHSPRERRPAPRVKDDFQPSTMRYWNARNNGFGNYYVGRGGSSFGNGPRRYGRLNPWGNASGYSRQGNIRNNGYRDLDAPN